MPLAYRIRIAEPDDAGGIAGVHVASWRSAYAGILPPAMLAGLSEESRATWRRQSLATSRAGHFVATAPDGAAGGECVVGFCDAGPNRDAAPQHAGEVWAIYLLADAQRQGIGRALFGAARDWLSAQALRSVCVWVLEANQPARRFYERLGGHPAGSRTITIAGHAYPEVAYGWPDPAAATLAKERAWPAS